MAIKEIKADMESIAGKLGDLAADLDILKTDIEDARVTKLEAEDRAWLRKYKAMVEHLSEKVEEISNRLFNASQE